MKKHITLLSGLLLVTGAFAQQGKINAAAKPAKLSTEKPVATTVTPAATSKALGTTFYTNDFSTPSDWTINNSGQSGSTYGWTIDNTVDGWWAPTTGIASTSEGNFAELTNGDPTQTPGTQALNVTYTLTTTSSIPLTNGTNISLEFLQYGARFNDLQEIQISTNGTTFVAVGNNNDFDVLSQAGGSPYPNPSTKTINLASYLTSATEVWIRFSWTTNFPSSATNANVWVAYGWYIDDVKLTTNADYDLKVQSTYWGSEGLAYYQIPTSQIVPIDFSANVLNNGADTLNNVVYNVNIAGAGTFAGTSNSVSIFPLNDDSLAISTQFTPSAVGTYNVTRSFTSTETDDIPANNALANYSFAVTDFIYARDNSVYAGYTDNQTDGFEAGNFYDIFAEYDLEGVNTRFATGTPLGSEVYARIYSIDANGDLILEAESDLVALVAGNLNSNYFIPFSTPLTLVPGTYMAMVGTYDPNVRIANAGTTDPQTSFFLDGNDITVSANLFYTTDVPVVRLNFDPSMISVDEIAEFTNLNVAPNPFNNETAIKFDLKAAAEVSVEVTDLAGRVVFSAPATQMNEGTQTIAIDGAAFGAGVYNATLKVGNSVTTKRIVKK
ncbi:MAG: T9SS type A sorting domain-containing protein [Fluviicola sp.]|nr:T9SS type A sorting domain-containing protein [Fluviicola sp.]